MERAIAALHVFLATLSDSAPWMIVGFLLAGFVHVFVDRAFLLWWLGGRGLAPVVRGALVGSCLPVCSCGVVPIALGLHRSGASKPAVMAFLVTGPALSPATLVVMTAKLGLAMTAFYASVAISAALIAAQLVGWMEGEGPPAAPPPSTRPRFLARPLDLAGCREMATWGLGEFGAEMSVDIVFGLLVATVVTHLVPPEIIASRLGSSTLATYGLVALIAAPLYVCTLPSIPVIRALIQHGMSPGAGLTYLMSGSATNLGELRAMSRRLGPRVAWVFFGVIAASGIIGGLLCDRLLGHAVRPMAPSAVGFSELLAVEA